VNAAPEYVAPVAPEPVYASSAAMSEVEAKAAYFAKRDAPTWGKGVVVPTAPAEAPAPVAVAAGAMSEAAAKAAYFAKRDAPTWGR